MHRHINIHDARKHFSRLIQEAAQGEEIVIAKAGKPVARLVPYQTPAADRQPGIWRDRVRISPDFDSLPKELESAFRGETD